MTRALTTSLLILSVLTAIPSAGAQPETGVAHEEVLAEFLEALRSDGNSQREFLRLRFDDDAGDTMDTMEMMESILGKTFSFHGVLERSPDRIVGLVADEAGERWTGVVLEFRGSDGSLSGLGLRHAERPGETVLSSEARAEIVRDAAVWIRRGYVLEDLGNRMADALLARLGTGGYDGFTGADALAMRLTDDLRDIYQDKHLRVLTPLGYDSRMTMYAENSSGLENPRVRHRWYEHAGIEELWWKEGPASVAVARFSRLIEGSDSLDAIRRALREMAERDGIVLDLRGVPGGDGSLAHEIASHFLEQRTQIARMEIVEPRTGERSIQDQWLDPGELGPLLRGKPCFVLVDRDTGSAAESLAGLLRRLGGATLIGERTAGAGHLTTTVALAEGFGLQLPIGRGLDGESVEGVGLKPDIKTAPEDALDRALELLGTS